MDSEAIKARTILDETIKQMARDAEKEVQKYHPDFKLHYVKCDWDPTRKSHRGGLYKKLPGISMAMYLLFGTAVWVLREQTNAPFKVYEYASFDSDHIIGGFYTDNWFDRARCYVAHEVAHAIQFWLKYTKKVYDRPHGESFKAPYRMLRSALVNPILPNQTKMLAAFNEYKKAVMKNETHLSR